MSEPVEYVDPTLLNPDPHQPRKEFDEDKLKQLAQSFDAQGVIEPIEIDENNKVRRGERRWRAALNKGLEKVPVRKMAGLSQSEWFERQLIDDAHGEELSPQERVWAWATGIVNINENTDYTIEDIKQMYKDNYEQLTNSLADTSERDEKGKQKSMGASALADKIGIPQVTISDYMSFFKVGRELQDAFMDKKKKVGYTYLQAVARIDSEDEQRRIEKVLVEDFEKDREDRTFKAPIEVREYATNFNRELEEAVEERAEEIREEKEKPKPEPPKEVVEKKAKEKAKKPRKKTPQEKARASLLTGSGNAQSKIEKARDLDIDVTQFEHRLEAIKQKIEANPGEAYEEAKQLKRDVDDAREEVQKMEEEKKREAKIKEKAKEEAKKELLEDEEFRKEVIAKEEMETKAEEESVPDVDVEKEIDDMVGKMVDAIKDTPEEKMVWTRDNKIQFIANFIKRQKLSCPVCGENGIMWKCGHSLR